MPASTYTLLNVINVIGFRAGNFKQKIDTLENPDLPTLNMIEVVNEVLRDLRSVKAQPTSNGRVTINTVAKYETGTVTVVQGSADVVGSGTTWTAAMQGRAFALAGTTGLYRIATVTDATHLQLDAAWAEDDNASAAYVIAQDRYSLPADFFDFVAVGLEGGGYARRLDVKRPSEIDQQRYSMRLKSLEATVPTQVTIWDRSQNGAWEIELDPFPDRVYQIQVRYMKTLEKLLHDHDVIPLPDESINYLYSGAVALWKSFNNPELANAYELWKKLSLSMYAAFDQRTTDEVPAIVPENVMRQGAVRSSLFNPND